MSKKGLRLFAFIGIFLLLLVFVSSFIFASYYEWWQWSPGNRPISNEPTRGDACGNDVDGGTFPVRVTLPPNSIVAVFIPRSYKMGFANRFFNIPTVPVEEVPSINVEAPDCEAGSLEPEGPYSIVQCGNSGCASKVSVEIGEPGKIPGNVFDGKQKYSAIWPIPSEFWIDRFYATNHGDDETWDNFMSSCLGETSECPNCDDECKDSDHNGQPDGDCSGCSSDKAECEARNAQIQANNEVLETGMSELPSVFYSDTFSNKFPKRTISKIALLTNGRKGNGNPCYVVLVIDNREYDEDNSDDVVGGVFQPPENECESCSDRDWSPPDKPQIDVNTPLQEAWDGACSGLDCINIGEACRSNQNE